MKPTCPNQHCKDYGVQDVDNLIKHGKDRHGIQRYLCRTCNRTFAILDPPKFQPWQRKKPKNIKSSRGQPELYNEVKEKRSFSITPTAIKNLTQYAKLHGISCSEVIECFARSLSQELKAGEENKL